MLSTGLGLGGHSSDRTDEILAPIALILVRDTGSKTAIRYLLCVIMVLQNQPTQVTDGATGAVDQFQDLGFRR